MILIVIPYRDRYSHLVEQLKTLAALPVQIIISEQTDGKYFNRGKMLNIGYLEGKHLNPTHVITHDVDLVCENINEGIYEPSDKILHLSAYCSQFGYKLPDGNIFGGVNLFPVALFEQINGYNNEYWGWGREDEDLLRRVWFSGLEWERREGRFKSLSHDGNFRAWQYDANTKLYEKMIANEVDYKTEGLNNCKYTVLHIENNYLGYSNVVKITCEI